MKTYQYAGKTVKAVKETNLCEGCCFEIGKYPGCGFGDGDTISQMQSKVGMPDCFINKIIFKLVTDEKV